VIYLFGIFTRYFDNLYDGAFMLLITGRIGISGLCHFDCDFNVGGDGLFWSRGFIFCLSMVKLHCCIVFCSSF
jgi:hypothetical protein